MFWKIKSLILDAVKPVEGNIENIQLINNTLNDKSSEIDSIKRQISKIDQYFKQLFNQSYETNDKIKLIER